MPFLIFSENTRTGNTAKLTATETTNPPIVPTANANQNTSFCAKLSEVFIPFKVSMLSRMGFRMF
ncbi:MAG: hypothetical protein SGI89_05485, partial [bacterium]|nr:hypothetical protein [bacterium]